MLKPALLAITSGEGEASILNKLQDQPNHVLNWQKGKVMVPDSAISCCQVSKHGIGLLLSLQKSP